MVGDFETVHPNNREFRCYDIARTLDKQYVLACNHSFVKSGQHWIRQHQLVIGHRLNQELISILRYSILGIIKEAGRWICDMFEAIQYLVSSKKLEDGFGTDNVAVANGRAKLQDYVMTILDLIFSLSKIILHVFYRIF
ncbi:hypothetical protein AAG906_011196 [Vitis piasezkii]